MARAWGSLAGMACREGTGSRVIAMTWKPLRGKGGFVRAFLPLLTCLMLVLTSFSGMAHAADLAGGSIAGVEFTIHTDGDIDQVPSDSDKNVPHHHNYCHGHDVGAPARTRSEEHTSELQSLMRISYAVFCLKKKNTNKLHSRHTVLTTSHY